MTWKNDTKFSKKKIDMYIRPYNHQCTNQSMHVRIMAEMVENVGGDGGAVTETAENGCGDDGKRRRKRHRWKHMSFCLMMQDLKPKYPHRGSKAS